MPEIKWLHLSDIHFNFRNFDSMVMRDSTLKYIESLGIEYDFIVITGDIAYKNGAYDKSVYDFLNSIKSQFLKYKNNLFIVPGNHDLARSDKRTIFIDGLQAKDRPSAYINDDLSEENYNELLSAFEGDQGFFTFYKNITGHEYPKKNLHFVQKRDSFNILHINTCLTSGLEKEEGNLLINHKKLYLTLKEIEQEKECKVNIAIAHHPLDWLSMDERHFVKQNLSQFGIDLYLSGHIHIPNNIFDETVVNDIQMIGCSAGIVDGQSEVGLITNSIDLSTGTGQAIFRKWGKNNQWIVDNEAVSKVNNGILTYKLAKFKKPKDDISIYKPGYTTFTQQLIDHGLSDSALSNEKLQVGEEYEFSLLKLNIIDYNKISKNDLLLKNFKTFVNQTVNEYNFYEFEWTSDNALFLFYGSDKEERAVSAGIKIILNLKLFNSNKHLNSKRVKIKIGLASHVGTLTYSQPIKFISGDCIDYLFELVKRETFPDTFTLSEAAYNNLSDDFEWKEGFDYLKHLDSKVIFIFKISSINPKPSDIDLDNLLKLLKDQKIKIFEKIDEIKKPNQTNFNLHDIRAEVTSFYDQINFFFQCFSGYDKNWSGTYFKSLTGCIKNIIKIEENLYNGLEEFCNKIDSMRTKIPKLPLINRINLSRYIMPYLKILLEKFLKQITKEAVPEKKVYQEFKGRIKKLIKSDDFEEELAFIEIIEYERPNLINYINNKQDDEDYQNLIARLWRLSHFVLIEDNAIKDKLGPSSPKLILTALSTATTWGPYFKVLEQCCEPLKTNNVIEFINECFKKYEISPTEANVTAAQICILINQSNKDISLNILKEIKFKKLWELIAYKKTSIAFIRLICEHFHNSLKAAVEGSNIHDIESSMMILFDLIFKQLKFDIEKTKSEEILLEISHIIGYFYTFNCFAAENFFDRLEDLLYSFSKTAKSFPDIDGDIIKNILSEYLNIKQKLGEGFPDISRKVLFSLPLPLILRLARTGKDYYLTHLIFHPNRIIANEIIRRLIHKLNLDLCLKFKINKIIFTEILSRELIPIDNKDYIYRALSHAWCTVKYAKTHYRKLSRTQLVKIGSNPYANPAVRTFINNILKMLINKL